jgi:hypothetical protein
LSTEVEQFESNRDLAPPVQGFTKSMGMRCHNSDCVYLVSILAAKRVNARCPPTALSTQGALQASGVCPTNTALLITQTHTFYERAIIADVHRRVQTGHTNTLNYLTIHCI